MDVTPLAFPLLAGDWVARARALRPLIEAHAGHGDTARELDPVVVEALHAGGFFRMLIPRALNGAELDLPTYVQVIVALAEADASVAWCVGQGTGCSFTAAYLPPEAGWEVFGVDPRAVLAWGAGPAGKALRAPGGWRVTAEWSYASGSRHANWMGGLVPLAEADGSPILETDGSPAVRSFIFPKGATRIVDDWQVMGLRGTGSDSYVIVDRFVPDSHCFLRTVPPDRDGTLYRLPLGLIYPMAFAGVALGISRAMLDSFIELASGKTPRGGRRMRDNAAIQSIIGQNEARWRAAHAFLMQTVRDLWAELDAGGALTDAHQLTLRLCTTHAIQEATAVVEQTYHEAGATAIRTENPFERRFRDMHAVSQQVQGRRANFELVGQALLGLPVNALFI